jgi:hypothetical protein
MVYRDDDVEATGSFISGGGGERGGGTLLIPLEEDTFSYGFLT